MKYLCREKISDDNLTFYINPLTVIGIINAVKKSGQNVFVHNAVASALGRQISRYA